MKINLKHIFFQWFFLSTCFLPVFAQNLTLDLSTATTSQQISSKALFVNFLHATVSTSTKLNIKLKSIENDIKKVNDLQNQVQKDKDKSISVSTIFIGGLKDKYKLGLFVKDMSKLQKDLVLHKKQFNSKVSLLNEKTSRIKLPDNENISTKITTFFDQSNIQDIEKRDVQLRIEYLEIFKNLTLKLIQSKSDMLSLNGELYFASPVDEFYYWQAVVDSRSKYQQIVKNELQAIKLITGTEFYKLNLKDSEIDQINKGGLDIDQGQVDVWEGKKTSSNLNVNNLSYDVIEKINYGRENDKLNRIYMETYLENVKKFEEIAAGDKDKVFSSKNDLQKLNIYISTAKTSYLKSMQREFEYNVSQFATINIKPFDSFQAFAMMSDVEFLKNVEEKEKFFINMRLLLSQSDIVDFCFNNFGKFKTYFSDSSKTFKFEFTNKKLQKDFELLNIKNAEYTLIR